MARARGLRFISNLLRGIGPFGRMGERLRSPGGHGVHLRAKTESTLWGLPRKKFDPSAAESREQRVRPAERFLRQAGISKRSGRGNSRVRVDFTTGPREPGSPPHLAASAGTLVRQRVALLVFVPWPP